MFLQIVDNNISQHWVTYIIVGAITFIVGAWLRGVLQKPETLQEEVNKIKESFRQEVADLKEIVQELKNELALNKKDDENERKNIVKDVQDLRQDFRELIKEALKK